MKLFGFFTLIAVKEPDKPEKPESYTLKLDGTVHLDGYNAQQGQALFYVEHKVGSDTGRVPAYYVVRFLTASYEAGVLMPGTEVPPGALADTDGTILVDTDGAYVTDGAQSRAGSDEDPLETLSFTYPPDSYGYANTLKVEAYTDPRRSRLIADGSFPITRDNPVYKARGEVWNNGLVFRNGEFILLDDKVYMWDYPVAGNSKIRPDLDRAQNPQFEDNIPYKLDDRTHWTPYDEWEVLATKVLFSQFALLGGAVMAGKMNAQGKYDYAKMYSQTGQDGTMSYERFDASKDAWDGSQAWQPNACVDFLKGTVYAKQGRFEGEIKGVRGSFQTLAGTFNEKADSTHKVGDPTDDSPYLSLGEYGLSVGRWNNSTPGNKESGVFEFNGDFYSQGVSNSYTGNDFVNGYTCKRSWRYYASDILCRGRISFGGFFPVLVDQWDEDTGDNAWVKKCNAVYLTGGNVDSYPVTPYQGREDGITLRCPLIQNGRILIRLYSPVNYAGGDYYKPGADNLLTAGVFYNMVIIRTAVSTREFVLEDAPVGAMVVVVNRSGSRVRFESKKNTWITVRDGNCLVFAKCYSNGIGDTYTTGYNYHGDGWYCINEVNQ